MQNAKDSFYMALRTRLTVINPARTVLMRGAVRPGIVVEEAEAPFSQIPADVFILRWLSIGIDTELDFPMMAAECEISFQTMGTQAFGGLDRGRLLNEMDKELLKMLTPMQSPKINYATNPPTSMLTQIYWDEPRLGPAVMQGEKMSRLVKVKVYCYLEEGE
jgi:hypothetical protein